MKNFKGISHFSTSFLIGIACLFTVQLSWSVEEGKKAFDANCKACHQSDRMGVGPSMVYMKDTYTLQNRAQFIEWVLNPGKKNPDKMQMPAMAHLSPEAIASIHDYILLAAKHLKEREPKPKFPVFRSPAKPYPHVMRRFMPFTSPATIAVALSPKLSVAWDSSIGKVRYAYPSNKNFFNGERIRQQNKADMMYQETAYALLVEATDTKMDFKGYRLHDGSPEFIYMLGQLQVSEKIVRGKNDTSFVRLFTIKGATKEVALNFEHIGNAKLSSNHGTWSSSILRLSAEQAASFSVEVEIL